MDIDPTFGYTREQLLAVEAPPPPADFEAFWRESYRLATAQPPSYSVERALWSPNPDVEILVIRWTAFDGASVGMWLSRPRESKGGLLIGQGYGNLVTPPVADSPGMTTIMPCMRGLGLSQCLDIPWQTADHAAYKIESREEYVIRKGVMDLWTAISILTDLYPDTADNICFSGGSLGGGTGLMAIPWDDRIRAGHISVPTLGGPFQLQFPLPDPGPGHTRRERALADPAAMRTLRYCDAASAARFIRVPLLFTPALSDASNPPPAQFAMANAVPAENRILRILEVGHAAPTAKDQELGTEIAEIKKRIFRL